MGKILTSIIKAVIWKANKHMCIFIRDMQIKNSQWDTTNIHQNGWN